MNDRRKYHPGVCAPTDRVKKYGVYLTPQRYDSPRHLWHLAKDKNWGPWSCCGGAVNSPPCQPRPEIHISSTMQQQQQQVMRGVGAHIQFLINDKDLVRVVGEDRKVWILESDRIAKKCTEGTSWKWLADFQIDGTNSTTVVNRGVGAQIQFLINDRDLVRVVGEDRKVWILESGRVAKKKTEGTSWKWLADLRK